MPIRRQYIPPTIKVIRFVVEVGVSGSFSDASRGFGSTVVNEMINYHMDGNDGFARNYSAQMTETTSSEWGDGFWGD